MRLKKKDLARAIVELGAACERLKEGRPDNERALVEVMLLVAAGCNLSVHRVCARQAGRLNELEEVERWVLDQWTTSTERHWAQKRKGEP